ncbi:hypothetical protein CYY_008927 [Polysphondylium violaceum]|uniref:Uncharacterized protein n=1 Tax=Polysphondylium violaceum TaxID=133409 RepID=A0A8J4UPU9_9MYCE|nr:hypothetical protein CYY_008927 [Polysphondylium violaceum]
METETPTSTTTTTTNTATSMDTSTPTVAESKAVRNDQYINTFYEIANKLDASPSFADDDKLYLQIIDLSQKTKQTKQLSSQFLAKYFKRFPSLQEKAINSLIDLFESDDLPVRINALKAIPTICRDNPEHIVRLADILGQLLNTDSKIESENIKSSLISLYKLHSVNTINSILAFLESEESDPNQHLMLSFLKEHLLPLIRQEYAKSTVETQTYFRDRIIKILPTAKEEETTVLLELLNCFPQYKIQDLIATIDLFIPQIESKPINDNIKKIFHFMRSLIHKSNQTNENISCKIFDLYLNKLIPATNELDAGVRAEMYSYLAQISPIMNSTDASLIIEPIFNYFKTIVPTSGEEIDLPYSIIESLLYCFANFGYKSMGSLRKLCGYKTITGQPSDMNAEVDPTKFADLLARFRFLDEKSRETALKAQKAIQAKPAKQAKSSPSTTTTTTTTTTPTSPTTSTTPTTTPAAVAVTDEKAIRQLAKKTLTATKNINALIAQLSKNPPVLSTSSIQLSSSITRINLKKFEKSLNKPNQNNNNQNNNNQNNQKRNNQNQNNNTNNNNNNSGNSPKVGGSGPQRTNKQTRYQPYVVPGRKQQQEDVDSAHLSIVTEKHKKPSNFKGRGNKNY